MVDTFRWIALASSIVFVVSFVGVIVSRSSSPPEHQTQSAEHKIEQTNKEGAKTLWDSWFPDPLSLYTLALVVFTAVLAFGGLYQLRALERAELISAEAANAAKDAANATRDSVRLAESTAERQLRAYVFIQDVNISLLGNDTSIDITVIFRNSGQTPGYDLRTSFKSEIKMPPPDGSPYTALDPPESKSIIAPGAAINIGPNNLILQPGDLAGVRDGTRKLYIWGRLDYVDAFGADRHFIFQGTNGQEIVNTDIATGRVNWRGWAMRPSPDGYKAN